MVTIFLLHFHATVTNHHPDHHHRGHHFPPPLSTLQQYYWEWWGVPNHKTCHSLCYIKIIVIVIIIIIIIIITSAQTSLAGVLHHLHSNVQNAILATIAGPPTLV